jgi:hypothetical protein
VKRPQEPHSGEPNPSGNIMWLRVGPLLRRIRSQAGIISPAGDSVIALVVFVLVFGVAAMAVHSLYDAHMAKRAAYEKSMEVRELYGELQKWSRNAYAYIIPAFDSTGAANADRHEFAECFTSVDGTGHVADHYYAWNYNAAAQTMQEIAYDAPSTGGGVPATNVKQISHVYPNIVNATATRTSASSMTLPQFGGHIPGDALVTMCNGAIGGNSGLAVHYDNGYLQVDQSLKTRLDVSGFTVNVATFQRGPLVRDPVKLVYVRPGDTNPTAYYSNGTVAADLNGIMSISEAHYYPVGGGPAGNGTFTIDTSACGANVAASPAALNANDATPVATSILGQQWSTDCNITVRDDHGSALNTEVIVYGPLVVTPTSLLFVSTGAGAQTVNVHEDYYPGAFTISANTCGSSIIMSGMGNGPDTSFTVAPSVPTGGCTFNVNDDHGGTQVVNVKIYGVLTVTPAQLVFNSPSSPAQGLTAHEDFYPGVITSDLTTANGGSPGCAPYASIDSTGMTTDSGWNAPFNVTPHVFWFGCAVTFRDDHGGIVQANVIINQPQITCPDGTVVGFGTPCPVPTPTPPCGPSRSCRAVEALYIAGGGIQDQFHQEFVMLEDGQVLSAGFGFDAASQPQNWAALFPGYTITAGTNCVNYGSEGQMTSSPIDNYPPIATNVLGVPYAGMGPSGVFTPPWFGADAALASAASNNAVANAYALASSTAQMDFENTEISTGYPSWQWWQDESCDP